MNYTINLSHYRQRNKFHYEKPLKILTVIAITAMFVVVLLASSFFVLNSTSSLSIIKRQQTSVTTSLNLLRDKAITIFLIKDRLIAITTIFSTRSSYEKLMQDIRQQISTDTTVDAMSLKNSVITVTLSSPSLQSLESFLNKTVTLAQQRNYKKLTVTAINTDTTTGKFSLSLEIDML